MDTKKIFTKFLIFLNELNESFGSKHNNIFLYYKLCKKTSISNTTGIDKHIEYLKRFLIPNKSHIISMNYRSLEPHEIRFDKSEKVFINCKEIIELSDKETRITIFRHLQLLLLLIVPDEDREVVRDLIKSVSKNSSDERLDQLMTIEDKNSKDSSNEDDFLERFVKKVEEKFKNRDISSSSNPIDIAKDLMESGILTDMTSNMKRDIESGQLRVDKLVGNIQNMISKLSGGENGEAIPSNVSNMISSLTSISQSPNISSTEQPSFDPSSLMNMASSLMSNLGGQTDSSQPSFDPSSLMNMASSLMTNLGGQSDGTQPSFDPSSLMNMASSLMSNLGADGSQPAFDPSNLMNMASSLMTNLGADGTQPAFDPNSLTEMLKTLSPK